LRDLVYDQHSEAEKPFHKILLPGLLLFVHLQNKRWGQTIAAGLTFSYLDFL